MSVPERNVVGRAVVYTLFCAAAAYLLVTVIGGILVNLYGKPPPDTATSQMSARQRAWCTRTIIALRDEIEGNVTLELQHPRTATEPLRRWRAADDAWLARLAKAKDACATAHGSTFGEAYGILDQIHTRYARSVEDVTAVRTEHARGLTSALQRLRSIP